MEGHLRSHPLVELLHEISDARLSGALRLAFERVKAVVYFEGGQVVAAVSNLRSLRLTEIMLRSGIINAQTLFSVAGEGASDDDAATALVGSGMLEESELRKARERQTAEVLRDVLHRHEGEWGFDPRVRLAAERHSNASIAPLLIEGARELAPEVILKRMANDSETLTPAPDAAEKLETGGLRLSPAEGFILSRIYESMSMRYVIAISGLPEDETRRAIYTLALGGLITRERWPRVLPAYISTQAAARTAAQAPLPKSPKAEAAPASEPETQAAITQQPKAQEATAHADAGADPRELIDELLALARGETHYAVLGVTRSSTPEDIKRAYYSLARRLHPDRLRRVAERDEQQRIDAAFAKIAQAYEVLKDMKLRAAYELKLEKQRTAPKSTDASARHDSPHAGRVDAPASDARPENLTNEVARQKFRQGLAAYTKKDYAAARLLFGEAARLDPRRALYRAHFGRVLARDKTMRRQAEAELLTAVSLVALDASIRVMLAQLYIDVGLRRKAEAQLEHALALEPTNAEAHALSEELRRSDT